MFAAAGKLGIDTRHIPDRPWFTKRFTFTPADLLSYVKEHRGLSSRIQIQAEDYLIEPPKPYFMQRDGDFETGWYSQDGWTDRKVSTELDEAAADYVLLFWHMLREGPFAPPRLKQKRNP